MSTKNVTYRGLTFEPFISHEEIARRVAELGQQISDDFRGQNPLIVCVLTGAFAFAADLFRQIDTDAEITFIRYKSYVGTTSAGPARQLMGLSENEVKDRPVIIVEDIVDTGRTMVSLLADINLLHPAQIKVATLLFKPQSLQVQFTPDYVGFVIPPAFIIGYGLDIDSQARNLKDIYVVKQV